MNRAVVVIACLVIHFTASAQFRKNRIPVSADTPKSGVVSSLLSPDVTNYKGDSLDMYLHNLYVKSYMGEESKIHDFDSIIFANARDPYPYIYATWLFDGVVSLNPKKQPHQL